MGLMARQSVDEPIAKRNEPAPKWAWLASCGDRKYGDERISLDLHGLTFST
jgi:hypothetical protein